MALEMIAWLMALPLLGTLTGFRTLTPMAVLCWFAYTGHLSVEDTWASWTGKLWVAIAFTVLAVGELIVDKLPKTGDRTAPLPLVARLSMGGLIGAIVAAGLDGPGIEGVILGVAGAMVGTYGGFLVRRRIVQRQRYEDWQVALVEDAVTVGCAVVAMGVVTA
jgi:uncharacterized membrane protein